MNSVQVYHQWAPSFVGSEDLSATSRQFNQVVSFLNGVVTNVPFDLPTVMALLIVFFFIVQFYWTLITITLAEITSLSPSSSASTTTTTTTSTTTAAPKILITAFEAVQATARTQTVTPAPAPEWRHLLRDFDLPHWVVKRSADVQNSGIQYRHNYDEDYSKDVDGALEGALGSRDKALRRRLSYIEASKMWKAKPMMDLQYGANEGRGRWAGDEALDLSSHRLVNLPNAALNDESSEVASSMLYAAERWGDRLQQWHVISPEGGQLLMQTLLMMRCAMGGVAFCAKLDHHFRRQHDLNLAAEMMNYHEDDHGFENDLEDDKRYDYGSYEVHEHFHPNLPDRAWPAIDRGPGRVYVAVSPPPTQTKVKVLAQRRHNRLHDADETTEESLDEGGGEEADANKRISNFSGVGKTSWNIYIFMSVMAVLVFLMDASYRILRVVSASTGRALQDPHQDVLTALTAAIRRWETINTHLHT